MLKATSIGKYRKPSGWVLTYAVTGPAAEVDEYVTIASAGANKTPDQWSRTASGAPLFYLPETQLLRNGQLPKSQYSLVKSHDGLRFFIDTTAEDNARNARIMALSETAEADIMAKIRFGILTVGAPAAPAVRAIPTTEAPAITGADIADDIAAGVQAGAAVGAGTEVIKEDLVGNTAGAV